MQKTDEIEAASEARLVCHFFNFFESDKLIEIPPAVANECLRRRQAVVEVVDGVWVREGLITAQFIQGL